VILYGHESGTWFALTRGQISNTAFLLALFLFDVICLLFAWSLSTKRYERKGSRLILRQIMRAQSWGFLVLLVMALSELFLPWFNRQYVFLVPLALLAEEFAVAREYTRIQEA
jgi:hypothetical protein